jgi:outer membrane immunogenic protein
MRKELLAATALSSAALAMAWPLAASAQSLTSYSWTGFYIGGAAGAHFGSDAAFLDLPEGTAAEFDAFFVDGIPFFPDTPVDADLTPWPTRFDFEEVKPALGVFGGYNYQVGRIVLGIEADWFWLGDHSSETFNAVDEFLDGQDPVTRTTDVTVYGGVESLFTLRPRIGFAATDRLLLFGTGGLAVGDALIGSNASIVEEYTDVAKSADWAGENSSWEVGYAVGGGAELGLTDNVSIKLEGLYYNLGDLSTTVEGVVAEDGVPEGTAQPYRAEMEMDGAIARLGVSFRF